MYSKLSERFASRKHIDYANLKYVGEGFSETGGSNGKHVDQYEWGQVAVLVYLIDFTLK